MPQLQVETVDVVDIPLFARDIPTAVEIVRQGCLVREGDHARCISATGAHGIVHAQEEPSFKILLQDFYMNLPDGKPCVWVGRYKGATRMQRCYGPDFFAALVEATASDDRIGHYLCGGKPGIADQLSDVCLRKFGNGNIVGTHSPPFRALTEDEFRQLGEEIDGLAASIVWIGISTPKQEIFAQTLAGHCRASFIIAVGAAFDFHTGQVRQAPSWMQQAGLEWFFRLLMEPKRLYRRYLKIVPAFIGYNLNDLAKRK